MFFPSSYSNDQGNKKFQEIIHKNNVFYDFQTGLSFCVAKLNSAHVCALIHFARNSSAVKFQIIRWLSNFQLADWSKRTT